MLRTDKPCALLSKLLSTLIDVDPLVAHGSGVLGARTGDTKREVRARRNSFFDTDCDLAATGDFEAERGFESVVELNAATIAV